VAIQKITPFLWFDPARAEHVMQAILKMKKLDIRALEQA
jgi:predicted 3-demethylubiquinone-9 3-methyltransferase (glyoxalase superfamily)